MNLKGNNSSIDDPIITKYTININIVGNGKVLDSDNKEVSGTAKGNYTNTVSGTYRITKASLASARVGNIAAQVYTGKPITLDPSTLNVVMKKTKLNPYDDITKEGDYIIKGYSNNTKVGTATITLQGVGNYGDIKTVKFKINAKGFKWWWRK